MKNLKVMNNTLFNTSMKQSIKYICMFLMLVGINGNVWGTDASIIVQKSGASVSSINFGTITEAGTDEWTFDLSSVCNSGNLWHGGYYYYISLDDGDYDYSNDIFYESDEDDAYGYITSSVDIQFKIGYLVTEPGTYNATLTIKAGKDKSCDPSASYDGEEFSIDIPITITYEPICDSHTITLTGTPAGRGTNGTFSADKSSACEDATITLTATPSSGYELDEWTVSKASSGTCNVTSNQFTMPDENVTVNATFKAATYSLSFNANGGSGSMDAVDRVYNSTAAIPANTFIAPTGKVFDGWATSLGGDKVYNPGANYTMGAGDATLYAHWRDAVYNDYKFACVDPVEAEVTQWTQKDIEVVANIGTANKVVAKMGSTTTGAVSIGTPKTTNTYTFTFNMLDFSEKENKSMILYWRNGSTLTGVSLVTLPSIISLTAGEGGSWDGLAIAPTEDDIVVINEPMTIDVADARAKEVVIKGSGSLTIGANQALIVDSKIRKFADGAFGGTSSSDLVILSDEKGTGALITGEESNNTQATVQFYTKAYKDATHGWVNQYFGIPFENTNTGAYAATGTYLYEYTVSSNSWTNIYSYAPMRAFHAYNILRRDASAGSYWLDGTLNFPGTTTNKDHVVNFTRRAEDVSASIATDEMFANSWTAPIDVTQMETTDFVGMDAELFIFNAGTASQVENAGGARGTSAGQWQNMPIATVKAHPEDFGDYTVIPSMQAVMVHITGAVNDPHTLTLDYKRLVYEPAASDVKIKPLHAPRQLAENSTPSIKLHMDVTGESGYGDRVMTYIGQEFTSGYDNGCDGRKIGGAGYAPKFYAITEDGNMSINSVPEIEGQLLGFKAGSEDDVYMLTFQYTGDQTYYLNDMKEQVSTPITDASSYTFYSTPDDEEARFIISKTPYNSPSIATGMDELNTSNKARKQMIDGILYIIRDGRIYSAEGSIVK